MDLLSGYQASGLINGLAYAFAEFDIKITAEAVDVTNSEGEYEIRSDAGNNNVPQKDALYPGVYQGSVDSPAVAEITIKQATLDRLSFPWLFPLRLREGLRVRLSIRPDRVQANEQHAFPCVQITEIQHSQQAKAGQPFSFTCRSVGKFTLAGQA